MKRIIKIGAPLIAIVILVAAAVSPAKKPIAPFEREQTKGNVRVVLLKVERSTIFTADGIRDAEPGKMYPVPTIGVTYLIEALGTETVTNWIGNEAGDDILVNGREIPDDSQNPENLVGGGWGGVFGADSRYANGPVQLPKSYDKKRTSVQERHERVQLLSGGTMRLKLVVGFNGEKETFIFDNIRLN
jgi:hypothetical protein